MIIIPANAIFYAHGFITILIIALLFTLIGYLIGRALWGRRKLQADRMEALNSTLVLKKESLAQDQKKLSQLLQEYSKISNPNQ